MHKYISFIKTVTFVEYACLFIGCFFTFIYSWLLDDAYVYFRYVDNFLFLRHGLVYNAGEYVEGFSSPFYVLFLVVMRCLPISYWFIVRAVGVLSFIIFWHLLLILNRYFIQKDEHSLNFPMILLSANYGVLCYFTSGLESPFINIAAVCYALFFLYPNSIYLQFMAALSPLIRHELILTVIISLFYKYLSDKRFPFFMTMLTILFAGSWVIFRIYYYADILPNTFYLKNVSDWRQGLLYLHDTLGTYRAYFVFPIIFALYLMRTKCVFQSCLCTPRCIMLFCALVIGAYVVKIGGDPRHFRYLAFSYILLCCSTAGMLERIIGFQQIAIFRKEIFSAFGIAVLLFAATCCPPQLERHPIFMSGKVSHVNRINDAAAHRYNRKRTPSLLQISNDNDYSTFISNVQTKAGGTPYRTVMVSNDCAENYRAYESRVVHSLGLTEPILARVEILPDRPGHKFGLIQLALDLAQIIEKGDNSPYPGMYDDCVESEECPAWIKNNISSIRIIEQKMLNQHNIIENLKLSLIFPRKIQL